MRRGGKESKTEERGEERRNNEVMEENNLRTPMVYTFKFISLNYSLFFHFESPSMQNNE